MKELGITLQDGMNELQSIALGIKQRDVCTYRERTNPDTQEREERLDTRVVSNPTFGDRIRAWDILAKISGHYAKQKLATDELKYRDDPAYRELRKRLQGRARIKKTREEKDEA